MSNFNQIIQSILNEGRDAPLYHGTDFDSAIHIINENKIKGKTRQIINKKEVRGVSLSRDLVFVRRYTAKVNAVIFVLDQRKLSQNHKIVPVDHFRSSGLNADHKGKRPSDREELYRISESEEFIIGDLKDVKKSLIGILSDDPKYLENNLSRYKGFEYTLPLIGNSWNSKFHNKKYRTF